jgi:hypothetical protein
VLRKRCDELESLAESSARALRNERARAVDLERRAESAGAGAGRRPAGLGGKPLTPGADKVCGRARVLGTVWNAPPPPPLSADAEGRGHLFCRILRLIWFEFL